MNIDMLVLGVFFILIACIGLHFRCANIDRRLARIERIIISRYP